MTGFLVPPDLADLDLTLAEVREIILNRLKGNALKTRLANLPKRAKAYEAEIAACGEREAALLDGKVKP